jgi:hypothetical protein
MTGRARGITVVMPFGRYRDAPLPDVPTDYLDWLASLGYLRDPLKTAVAEERARRHGHGPDPRIVEDLIAAGQRALARRHHPDGGTDEAMLAVRIAADWLFAHAAQLRGVAA